MWETWLRMDSLRQDSGYLLMSGGQVTWWIAGPFVKGKRTGRDRCGLEKVSGLGSDVSLMNKMGLGQ